MQFKTAVDFELDRQTDRQVLNGEDTINLHVVVKTSESEIAVMGEAEAAQGLLLLWIKFSGSINSWMWRPGCPLIRHSGTTKAQIFILAELRGRRRDIRNARRSQDFPPVPSPTVRLLWDMKDDTFKAHFCGSISFLWPRENVSHKVTLCTVM